MNTYILISAIIFIILGAIWTTKGGMISLNMIFKLGFIAMGIYGLIIYARG